MDPYQIADTEDSPREIHGQPAIAWSVAHLDSRLKLEDGTIPVADQVAWEIVKARLLAGHQMLQVVDTLASGAAQGADEAKADPLLFRIRRNVIEMREEMAPVLPLLGEGE